MKVRGTVIITGGTKGLGEELSMEFGRNGYQVVAIYRSDSTSADRIKKKFESNSIVGRCIEHDVTRPMPDIGEVPGPITIIHNAGIGFNLSPIHLRSWSEFEVQIEVALKGAYMLTQAFLRRMVQDKAGCFVSVLSKALLEQPPKGFASYLTAKCALEGFTKSLAAEYNHLGIKALSVCPGYMETELTKEWPEAVKNALKASSSKGDAREYAEAISKIVVDSEFRGIGETVAI